MRIQFICIDIVIISTIITRLILFIQLWFYNMHAAVLEYRLLGVSIFLIL